MSSRRQPEIALPERYVVLRHLADGGMASVWSAWDSLLHRKVAVKVLARRYLDDRWAMRRFAREARAAARVSSHRNIATIYDIAWGEPLTPEAQAHPAGTESSPTRPAFIVMEHLVGGTVGDAIRTRSYSPHHARRWIHEAAAALDYAHREGVVHCDIKPGNLLLDSERVVHVSDFGLARIANEEMGGGGERLGTAAYLSPEQAAGAQATPASDRYALAVVAFELLTGQRPFVADHAAVIRHHRESQPPVARSCNAALPRALDQVLARGLAKREEERWPSALAFASAVDAALSQRGSRSFRSPRPAKAKARIRRGPAAAVAGLAASASVAGVAIGVSHRRATDAARARPARRAAAVTHPVTKARILPAATRRPEPRRPRERAHASPPPSTPVQWLPAPSYSQAPRHSKAPPRTKRDSDPATKRRPGPSRVGRASRKSAPPPRSSLKPHLRRGPARPPKQRPSAQATMAAVSSAGRAQPERAA